MNGLNIISIVSWIAMWLAFHFGHPAGYVIAIVGLAASVAIADETTSRRSDDAGDEPGNSEHANPARSPGAAKAARRRSVAANDLADAA